MKKNRGTCIGCVVTISRPASVGGSAPSSLYVVLIWPGYKLFAGLLMLIPLLGLLMKPYEAMHKTIEEIESQRDVK
ncbi:MAG: hypothetical protein Q6353_004915 [Candidatus Sigynarchaeum springense]